MSDYHDALAALFQRTTGTTKLGLERTEALLDAIGNPHDSLLAFHIAGTNGKGSVAAIIEAALRGIGLRVGKYTSPHLVDFRERIVVDGRPIDEDFVVEFIRDNAAAIERTGSTFFEATTAMAFDAFADSNVDVAVIETGLGGRLDSTNVLRPLVAAVTSIGMDHTEYLGNTLGEIAREKAGVFKSGVPAVIGEQSRELRSLLAHLARDAGAHGVHVVSDELPASGITSDRDGVRFQLSGNVVSGTVVCALHGRHQVSNVCTGIAALHAAGPRFVPSLPTLNAALAKLQVPGRCQILGNMVLDVAHNPDGTEVLADALSEIFPGERFTVLFCALGDKDWRRMLSFLSPIAEHFVLTDAPTAPPGRSWSLAAAGEEAGKLGIQTDVISDFDTALRTATGKQGRILITGSFHTVGDAMSRLQLSPLTR